MANPSLQIGNDNWAIKEDNLLGYSTAGTRFVPQPITMTRATLGTRVNPSGLVEDVALLGSEEVVNGDFDTTIPLGNTGSGWGSIVGDVVYYNGGVKLTRVSSTNRLRARTITGSDNILTQGKQYLLYYSVLENNNCTSFKAYHGGSSTTLNNTLGNHTIYFTQDSSDQVFQFTNNTNNSNITIDNVSVKEATIDNLPRVDYTDGTSSLLVEPQRTNLLTYSEDFSDSSWINTYTITPNSIISPDGTLNAYKITLGTGNGSLRTLNSVSSNTDYVFSFYAKRGTASEMKYRVFDFTIPFADIIPKTSYYSQTNTDSWVRIEVPFTTGASTTSIGCYIDSDSQGDGDFYVWGAQLEAGSYPTSYIKTSGSTVTRNQETYTKTGISDLINSEEGVLFIEASTFENGADCRITLSDGTIINRVSVEWDILANTIKGFVGLNGNVVSPATYNQTNFNKIALKYKENDCALWINGTEVDTDFNVSALSGTNQLEFSSYGGALPFEGKVKQLQIFKTALSDSELATLTT